MIVRELRNILSTCTPDAEVQVMRSWGVKLGYFRRYEIEEVEVNLDGEPTINLHSDEEDDA